MSRKRPKRESLPATPSEPSSERGRQSAEGDESAPAPVPEPAPVPALDLSKRHRKTLEAIFEKPTRADIPWRSIEALFHALGAEVTQRKGSRIGIALAGQRAVFHEPHPANVTVKGAVDAVRDFLEQAGIKP